MSEPLLVAGKIRAWRVWIADPWRQSDPSYPDPRLRSLCLWRHPTRAPWNSYPKPEWAVWWQPGQVQRAHCYLSTVYSKHLHNDESPPARYCQCGIYAGIEPGNLTGYANPSERVLGEVDLWGRVQKHQYGYRAQFAEIVSIIQRPPTPLQILNETIIDYERIAEVYGVPLKERMAV